MSNKNKITTVDEIPGQLIEGIIQNPSVITDLKRTILLVAFMGFCWGVAWLKLDQAFSIAMVTIVATALTSYICVKGKGNVTG